MQAFMLADFVQSSAVLLVNTSIIFSLILPGVALFNTLKKNKDYINKEVKSSCVVARWTTGEKCH